MQSSREYRAAFRGMMRDASFGMELTKKLAELGLPGPGNLPARRARSATRKVPPPTEDGGGGSGHPTNASSKSFSKSSAQTPEPQDVREPSAWQMRQFIKQEAPHLQRAADRIPVGEETEVAELKDLITAVMQGPQGKPIVAKATATM
eukprot:SAG31_NODE_7300_length_1727_cov_1.025184_1_plen_147_part_10